VAEPGRRGVGDVGAGGRGTRARGAAAGRSRCAGAGRGGAGTRPQPRGAARRARRPHRPRAGQARDPPPGGGAAGREASGGCRSQGADDDAPPGVHRQPRHREDHRRPSCRRHLPGARAALRGPPRRGRPLGTRRRLPRADGDQDGRGRRLRGRGSALHRRGLQPDEQRPQWRPVRARGRRHARQGDGGPPRRPRRHRGGLPGADGDLHRCQPRSGQPLPHDHRVRGLHRRRARRDPAARGQGCGLRSAPRGRRALPGGAGPHPSGGRLRQRPVLAQRPRGGDRSPRVAAAEGRQPDTGTVAATRRQGLRHRATGRRAG
jgi:hypothetical protein